MSYTYRGYTIRDDMLNALGAYLQLGAPLGDFLQSIVSNDLVHAAGHADDNNFANLQAYAGWLYNECPMDACGSREKYLAWIEKKATERQAYFDLLATHPWGWQESDDERAWLAGKEKDELLCNLRSSIDPDHSMWNAVAPDGKGEAVVIPWLESSLADETQEMEAVLSDGSSVDIVQAPNGSWYAFHDSALVAHAKVRASALAFLETHLKRLGVE